MTSALQAVLFDMDGLLVDTEPLWFESERTVMGRLGAYWAPSDQHAMLGGSLENTVSYMLSKAGAADGHQAAQPGFHQPASQQPASRQPDPEQVGDWLLAGMAELMLARGVRVLPGARELVAEVAAAGLPRALVTSSQRQIMDTVLAVTGLDFPVTVCGEDVTRTKPDPEPYLRAATVLGVDPARCVALEDSPNGVVAAAAAGCAVVMVPSLPVSQRPTGDGGSPGDGRRPGAGLLVVESLREVDLGRLRAFAATHPTVGASAAMCDDEGECRHR
jgi:HAD superfamily hydrolase (TIGR01509 family)